MRKLFTLLLLCFPFLVSSQSTLIDSLKGIVSLQRHDTVELEALLNLTFEFLRKDLAQAKRYSSAAVRYADTPEEVKWRAGAYNYLITIYQQSGNLDSAQFAMDRSREFAELYPAEQKLRYNFNQAAGLFYKNTGEFKKALPFMLDNKKTWTQEDQNRAGLLLNLGNLYTTLGQHKDAADHHLQALTLFEKLQIPRGQSFCLQSLGNDFFLLGQLNTAKEYYEKSLRLKQQLQDERGSLITTTSLGDVYKGMNDFRRAETYYQEALATARRMKIPSEEARVLHQSGLLYRRMQEREKARSCFNQSMILFKQIGDMTSSATSQSELLGLDREEQARKKTESLLLDVLNTHIRSGDRQQEALEYQRLSEYYESEGKFDKALYYLKKHGELTDSVSGNAVLVQLKELEERYKNNKKEQEIELLKKDQEIQAAELQRQRANTTLIVIILISVVVISILLVNRYRVMNRIKRQAELERVRQHIARDLHDDLGSTLSSIHIISQLALKQKGEPDAHLAKIATHSAHMMETMSDIVWSINPGNDTLEQVVARMKEFASEILEPQAMEFAFRVDPSVSELRLDAERRKNLFLIFKEAINNAAKYSEADTLDVYLGRENGSLKLKITDNGIGFDPLTVAHGNGLKNMADRARQMNGALLQSSESGKGSSVSLEVPIT